MRVRDRRRGPAQSPLVVIGGCDERSNLGDDVVRTLVGAYVMKNVEAQRTGFWRDWRTISELRSMMGLRLPGLDGQRFYTISATSGELDFVDEEASILGGLFACGGQHLQKWDGSVLRLLECLNLLPGNGSTAGPMPSSSRISEHRGWGSSLGIPALL